MARPGAGGGATWKDTVQGGKSPPTWRTHKNPTPRHYRAVAIDERGKRVRRAWGTNLHSILAKLQLFPVPYRRTVKEGG